MSNETKGRNHARTRDERKINSKVSPRKTFPSILNKKKKNTPRRKRGINNIYLNGRSFVEILSGIFMKPSAFASAGAGLP